MTSAISSPSSPSWKHLWLKVKGHAWRKIKCQIYLKVCHNHLVTTFSEDSHLVAVVDMTWYYDQVIFACNGVLNAFFPEKKPLCKEGDASLEQVIRMITQMVSELSDEACCLELQRILLSLLVIWLTKPAKPNDMDLAANILLQFEETLCDVNRDAVLLIKTCFMIGHSVFDKYRSIIGNMSLVFISCGLRSSNLCYLLLVLLFKKELFDLALKLCTEYVAKQTKENFSTSAVAVFFHNLSASCNLLLEKPATAITHWRKAIDCIDGDLYMIPLLFNLHHAYTVYDKPSASREILQLLGQCILKTRALQSVSKWPAMLFDLTHNEIVPASVVANLKDVWDTKSLTYYIANCYNRADIHDEAAVWYRKFLKHQSERFDPVASNHSVLYSLPIQVPSLMQVNAEYAFSIHKTCSHDDLLSIDTSSLTYCSNSFKQIQPRVPINDLQNSCTSDVNLFLKEAQQFYHCLCLMLYKISFLISFDLSQAKAQTDSCLQAMESVLPGLPNPADAGEPLNTDQLNCHSISHRLSSIKAKLFFNQGLILTKISNVMDKDVLSSIQAALHYDSKSLEMRWNVALLLWSIGQKEESIKTWCKTRSLNYKLGLNEVRRLISSKETSFSNCQSSSKKALLEKDLCILNELCLILSK